MISFNCCRRILNRKMLGCKCGTLLFIAWFGFILLLVKVATQEMGKNSLYEKTDPILELNSTNFAAEVYEKPKAFFIEFYSSWCGGCVAYAPTWKKFSKDVESWKTIVQISSVNCALDDNTALCREHTIEKYPTLKYFKYKSNSAKDGKEFSRTSDLEELASGLADLVAKDFENEKPLEWPSFEKLNDVATLDTVSSSEVIHVAVVFEDEKSTVANQIILDFSSHPQVAVLAATSNNHMVIKNKDMKIPALLIYKKDDITKPIFTSSNSITRHSATSQIRQFAGLLDVPAETGGLQAETPLIQIDTSIQYQVHMTDLLSGLTYMFRQEIGVRKSVEGKEIESLTAFLDLLDKYFPGTPPVRRILNRLHLWVKQRKEFTGVDWITELDALQEEFGRPFLQNITWMACKGSKPNYRGYPCSLWNIFHVLTVQAYKQDGKSPSFSALQVLEAIHGYIRDFFGCRECSEHFENGAQKLPTVVQKPEDVVLWLWRGHNIPNKFLAGSASEDPAFPKVQWPPKDLCISCQNSDGSWNEKIVLDFILKYYSDVKLTDKQLKYDLSSFDQGKGTKETKNLDLNPKFKDLGRNVAKEEERNELIRKEKMDKKWTLFDTNRGNDSAPFGKSWLNWTGIDTSICLSIWGVSVILVVFIYLYLKYRRNRTKFWKIYYSEYKV